MPRTITTASIVSLASLLLASLLLASLLLAACDPVQGQRPVGASMLPPSLGDDETGDTDESEGDESEGDDGEQPLLDVYEAEDDEPAGDDDGEPEPCETGTELCECLGNGTCNPGLVCNIDAWTCEPGAELPPEPEPENPEPVECPIGANGCACTNGGACDPGLVCGDGWLCEPLPFCGDGQLDAGEQCDDANGDNSDACTNACDVASCGDSFVWGGNEECDDGNTEDGDGCSSVCTWQPCGDGIVQQGEDCDDGNVDNTDACDATCSWASKLVFVSSQIYDGNLGGLDGADAKCQALADAAGRPGTFRAWLGDGVQGPDTRFVHALGPYVLVDGTVIANDWADLIDGTLAAAIDITEKGGSHGLLNPAAVGTACANANVPHTVWSGVWPDGTPMLPHPYAQFSATCEGWTSNAHWIWNGGPKPPAGKWGSAHRTDSTWTDACGGGQCNWTAALFCFQQ